MQKKIIDSGIVETCDEFDHCCAYGWDYRLLTSQHM